MKWQWKQARRRGCVKCVRSYLLQEERYYSRYTDFLVVKILNHGNKLGFLYWFGIALVMQFSQVEITIFLDVDGFYSWVRHVLLAWCERLTNNIRDVKSHYCLTKQQPQPVKHRKANPTANKEGIWIELFFFLSKVRIGGKISYMQIIKFQVTESLRKIWRKLNQNTILSLKLEVLDNRKIKVLFSLIHFF